WEDRDLLKAAGRQITGYLALDEAAQELSEGRQFQAFNQLTAFIMHDLKNILAQQSLVVKNAARHKDNPAFIEDAIATVDNSVQRMSRLLEQLQAGAQKGAPRRVPLEALARDVIEQCRQRGPAPVLEVANDAGELAVRVGRERFAMVLGHVVRNAQDAATRDGTVTLRLGRAGAFGVLEVIDNGTGMSEEFVRDRLFRPFYSTKGSKGMGIGAHQTRQFVREAGGDVEVDSAEGEGTVFRIRLPLVEEAAPPVASSPSAAEA
ncbi:MAG: XrtA/PEP-CTERM system histidine kinase PrsK, partial [Pseudomonadota bacterium]